MPAILAALGAIVGWFTSIGAGIAALITLQGLRFVATKAFWWFIIFGVMPVLLYNVFCEVIFSLLDVGMNLTGQYASDYSEGQNLAIDLTGMAGWIAEQIKLPQSVSAIMSATSVRFMISLIPFIGR